MATEIVDRAQAAAAALRAGRNGRRASSVAKFLPAPTFPADVLPPAVRAYVQAAAASFSAPAEMIAVPILGFAGALIGNRLHLILKHSYREYPTFYLAIVAPPGSAKTPALGLAQWPLDALQTEAEQVYRERKVRYEDELDAWRQTKAGDKPAKPRLRDYFSSNLTLEALFDMFDRAPGIAIIRDEILGWVTSLDQYRSGKGSDRQEYLSLWSSKTIKLDRKGADPIYRRFPVACVVGGIQPDLVGGLHNESQQRDGFVERLLPIVPDVGPMPWTEETISPGRYSDVLAVFQALDRLESAEAAPGEHAVGMGVQLSSDARRLYVAWFNENQALIARAEGLAAGFYSKLPAHVARLALILHALWHPDDPRVMVSAARMEDAIELGEFFRAHIGRFVALLQATTPARTAGTQTRIVRILRKSEGGNTNGWVTRSAIYDGLRNVSADDLTEALQDLLARETIERQLIPGVTKPTEQWRLRKVLTPEDYSEYSEYLPPEEENSEYSEYPNGGKEEILDAVYEEIVL